MTQYINVQHQYENGNLVTTSWWILIGDATFSVWPQILWGGIVDNQRMAIDMPQCILKKRRKNFSKKKNIKVYFKKEISFSLNNHLQAACLNTENILTLQQQLHREWTKIGEICGFFRFLPRNDTWNTVAYMFRLERN